MDQKLRKEWTAALRSGAYKQGKGYLTRWVDDEVREDCCLGVLCTLLRPRGRVLSERKGQFEYYYAPGFYDQTDETVLPPELVRWLGFESSIGGIPGVDDLHSRYDLPLSLALADLNDGGFTFAQIADVIDFFYSDEPQQHAVDVKPAA